MSLTPTFSGTLTPVTNSSFNTMAKGALSPFALQYNGVGLMFNGTFLTYNGK